MAILKGKFTSVWDGGTEITTPAELNTETGEVSTESVDAVLDREFFTSDEFHNAGEEFEVCPECHEYILKTVMKEEVGKTYEALVCSDPNCDNQ